MDKSVVVGNGKRGRPLDSVCVKTNQKLGMIEKFMVKQGKPLTAKQIENKLAMNLTDVPNRYVRVTQYLKKLESMGKIENVGVLKADGRGRPQKLFKAI